MTNQSYFYTKFARLLMDGYQYFNEVGNRIFLVKNPIRNEGRNFEDYACKAIICFDEYYIISIYTTGSVFG